MRLPTDRPRGRRRGEGSRGRRTDRPSPLNATGPDEKFGVQMRKRVPQLIDLGRRAVEFQTNEISHPEQAAEQGTDVVEMGPHRRRPGIPFPAEHAIAQGGEFVKQTARLRTGLVHKFRQQGGNFLLPARVGLEIRMQRDQGVRK